MKHKISSYISLLFCILSICCITASIFFGLFYSYLGKNAAFHIQDWALKSFVIIAFVFAGIGIISALISFITTKAKLKDERIEDVVVTVIVATSSLIFCFLILLACMFTSSWLFSSPINSRNNLKPRTAIHSTKTTNLKTKGKKLSSMNSNAISR